MFRKRLVLSVIALGCVLAANPAAGAVDALGNDSGQSAGEVEIGPPVPTRGLCVELISTCPSPVYGNDGLAWDGSHLWIADFDTDQAYRVDPSDCSVVHSIPLPGTYPGGLAWDGTHLWHADATNEMIYRLDPADGSVVASFPSPGGFPPGLAFDGSALWNSDTDCNDLPCVPDEIHYVSTAGAILSTYPALGEYPTGLAYDGAYLWHSDNALDAIYKLDPADLSVVGMFPSPGSYPNDLAWDGTHLWVVDNGTDLLYKYSISGSGASATEATSWGAIKSRYQND